MSTGLSISLVAGADLLGSVSFSVVIVKLIQGLDVRSVGSGNAGATNVSVVSQICGPAPCTLASVMCPAGSQATGGGGLVVGNPSNQLLFESRPASSGGLTGWEVRGGAATPPSTGQLLAYAVCASP